MNKKRYQQFNALRKAAGAGDVVTVKRYLDKGYPVDGTTEDDRGTALQAAARSGHLEMMRFLVERGADVNFQEGSHQTVLICAVTSQKTENVLFLLERGANINAQTDTGYTALACAASSLNFPLMEVLLKNGADPDPNVEPYSTPLVRLLENQFTRWSHESTTDYRTRRRANQDCIDLLISRMPDGAERVHKWRRGMIEGRRRWRRSFRNLFQLMCFYRGRSIYEDLLQPYLKKARISLAELEAYRVPLARHHDDDEHRFALFNLYALSRVNDVMLLSFQRGRRFTDVIGLADKEHFDYVKSRNPEIERRLRSKYVTREQYDGFWRELGFDLIDDVPYHPFFCEIVDVIPDISVTQPKIDRVFWPGLLFGQLLFSRMGVAIRVSTKTMDRKLAIASRLYFTYWRRCRETEDQSHGWGYNSQWGTEFRRDYLSKDLFRYNVDAPLPLHGDYWPAYHKQYPPPTWDPPKKDDPSIDERIELLVYRSYVRTKDRDGYPYLDSYVEPVPKSLAAYVQDLLALG